MICATCGANVPDGGACPTCVAAPAPAAEAAPFVPPDAIVPATAATAAAKPVPEDPARRLLRYGCGCLYLNAVFFIGVIASVLSTYPVPLVVDLVGGVELSYHVGSPDGGPPSFQDAEGAREALDRRLETLGVRGHVPVVRSRDEVAVTVPRASEEVLAELRAAIEQPLVVALLLVVTEAHLGDPREHDDEVERVRQAKRSGDYDPKTDKFDVALGREPGPLTLLAARGLDATAFAGATAERDASGRAAVAIQLDPKGRARLDELVGPGGREVAVVIDGLIVARETLKARVPERVVVAPKKGFDPVEQRRVVAGVRSGPMPRPLKFQNSQKTGPATTRSTAKLSGLAGVALLLLILAAVTPKSLPPPSRVALRLVLVGLFVALVVAHASELIAAYTTEVR